MTDSAEDTPASPPVPEINTPQIQEGFTAEAQRHVPIPDTQRPDVTQPLSDAKLSIVWRTDGTDYVRVQSAVSSVLDNKGSTAPWMSARIGLLHAAISEQCPLFKADEMELILRLRVPDIENCTFAFRIKDDATLQQGLGYWVKEKSGPNPRLLLGVVKPRKGTKCSNAAELEPYDTIEVPVYEEAPDNDEEAPISSVKNSNNKRDIVEVSSDSEQDALPSKKRKGGQSNPAMGQQQMKDAGIVIIRTCADFQALPPASPETLKTYGLRAADSQPQPGSENDPIDLESDDVAEAAEVNDAAEDDDGLDHNEKSQRIVAQKLGSKLEHFTYQDAKDLSAWYGCSDIKHLDRNHKFVIPGCVVYSGSVAAAYQQHGIIVTLLRLTRQGGFYNSDEPGMGKTRGSLGASMWYMYLREMDEDIAKDRQMAEKDNTYIRRHLAQTSQPGERCPSYASQMCACRCEKGTLVAKLDLPTGATLIMPSLNNMGPTWIGEWENLRGKSEAAKTCAGLVKKTELWDVDLKVAHESTAKKWNANYLLNEADHRNFGPGQPRSRQNKYIVVINVEGFDNMFDTRGICGQALFGFVVIDEAHLHTKEDTGYIPRIRKLLARHKRTEHMHALCLTATPAVRKPFEGMGNYVKLFQSLHEHSHSPWKKHPLLRHYDKDEIEKRRVRYQKLELPAADSIKGSATKMAGRDREDEARAEDVCDMRYVFSIARSQHSLLFGQSVLTMVERKDLQIFVELTDWQRKIINRTYENEVEVNKAKYKSEPMREKQIAESVRNKFVATFPYGEVVAKEHSLRLTADEIGVGRYWDPRTAEQNPYSIYLKQLWQYSAKTPKIDRWVQEVMAAKNPDGTVKKGVIMTASPPSALVVYLELKRQGLSIQYTNGTEPLKKNRDLLVRWFNEEVDSSDGKAAFPLEWSNKASPRMLVTTSKTFGTGISLPRANAMLFLEPPTNEVDWIQGRSRCHRASSLHKVEITLLYSDSRWESKYMAQHGYKTCQEAGISEKLRNASK